MMQLLIVSSIALASQLSMAQSTATTKVKGEDPHAILEKAEKIRNPEEDYICSVSLNDKKGKKKPEDRTYESSLKGRDKAIVKFLTPESERGTKVLMVGQDMWLSVPSSTNPIRISANQKLTGNAAYGDVARLSFIGNYTAKLARLDKFNGADAYVLDLRSKPNRPVTYDIVEYWVDKKSYRPLKAIYKTQSGKAIREGVFTDFSDVFGVQRPTTFILTNLLSKNHVTTLKFSNSKKSNLPDLMFERQNLGRN